MPKKKKNTQSRSGFSAYLRKPAAQFGLLALVALIIYLIASSANIMNPALLTAYFTLTGSTTIELQYWVTNSINVNDLGVAASTSSGEVYATLTIQQVA